MPRGSYRIAWAILWLLAAPALAMADDAWTLVSADFQSRSVGLTALDADHLTLMEGGTPRIIDWNSVLQLDHQISPQPTTGDFTLHLNGGDFLAGAPVSAAADTLTWTHPVLGQLDIPEDRVNAIVRNGKSPDGLDDPRATDSVRLSNGDSVSGVIEGVSATTVNIHTAGADAATPIALDKVDAILFADPSPRAVPPGRAFRVTVDDGSMMTFPAMSLASGGTQLSVGFSPQTAHPINLKVISDIEQVNGPVAWLTSLNPRIVYKPFLSESFPPRFDHPVGEPTVAIRDKYPRFHHGIGVHAYTKLTYTIPDGYPSFRTQYGIDTIPNSDSIKADVTVRIYLDDKPTKEISHVRAGPIADPLTIDLHGAKSISLEVDYGDNLAAQARFVWLDPAFLHAAPATQPSTQPSTQP